MLPIYGEDDSNPSPMAAEKSHRVCASADYSSSSSPPDLSHSLCRISFPHQDSRIRFTKIQDDHSIPKIDDEKETPLLENECFFLTLFHLQRFYSSLLSHESTSSLPRISVSSNLERIPRARVSVIGSEKQETVRERENRQVATEKFHM